MSLEFATQRLRLVPGAAIPVLGLREPLADRLLHGRAAALAPALLGRLYALCGQAHRICAEMALQALQTPDTPIPMDAAQRQALWRETLREHVRRLFLDWPRLLASPAPEAQVLAASPALGQSVLPGDAGLVEWVERQVLGMPWVRWQQACQQNPAQGLLQWAHGVHNPLTQALVQAHRWAGAWHVPLQALHTPQPGAQVLTDLASALRADGDFARQPRLREQCRETGCWTRTDDAWLPVPDAWTRLAARVLDLAQLAQAQGAQRLHAGACALGDGEAIAWCEMARGLLVHWLRVDAQGRVERYGVLAPTEWNFHPQGAAAQVLRGLGARRTWGVDSENWPQRVQFLPDLQAHSPAMGQKGGEKWAAAANLQPTIPKSDGLLDAQQPAPQLAAAVAVLVAAFDPCVDYALAPAGRAEEVSCA